MSISLRYLPILQFKLLKKGLVFLFLAVVLLGVPPSVEPEELPVVTDDSNPIETVNQFKPDSSFLESNPQQSNVNKILIPSVGIDLQVKPSPLIKGYWSVSPNTASHGLGTANPGETGNIVIFAHAREGLFLPIKKIRLGAHIYLLTAQKQLYEYVISDISTVLPNAVEVVADSETEILTLFTCTGFADQKRLILKATPLN